MKNNKNDKKDYESTYNFEEYRKNKAKRYSNPNKKYSYDSYSNKRNDYGTKQTNTSTKQPINQSDAKYQREEIRKNNQISKQKANQLRQKSKKFYRRRQIAMLLGVTVIVYLGIKLGNSLMYPTVSYQVVSKGVIDNSKNIQGIIFREENVYTSMMEGDINYMAAQGEKVRKDAEISFISNSQMVKELEQEINKVDSSLYDKQQRRENLSEYQVAINSIQNNMESEIVLFHNIRGDQMTEVYQLRNQLESMNQMRTNIYLTDTTDYTKGIQEERYELAEELSQNQRMVRAEESGVISYIIDGREESLTLDEMNQITYASFQKLTTDMRLDESYTMLTYVEEEEPLYKIISDDKWYIVAYVDNSEAINYEEGLNYPLIFPEVANLNVEFNLVQKNEEENKTKLVFETRDYLTRLLPYRYVTFSIGEEKIEGLKIPLTAIVEKNMLVIPEEYLTKKEGEDDDYVFRVRDEMGEYFKVEIDYKKDGNAYMVQDLEQRNKLQVGDTIRHPEFMDDMIIEHVESIEGVYTINGRYAKFKPIEIEIFNEDYAIVSGTTSNGVRELDQIISNPKNIKENQLLRYMDVQNK